MGNTSTKENKCEVEISTALGSMEETRVSDVQKLLSPLFMLFDFKEFNDEVYEDIVAGSSGEMSVEEEGQMHPVRAPLK